MADDFYIFSAKHTKPSAKFATFWRDNDAGYCWWMEWTGRYPREQVEAKPEYYNNGYSTVALPASEVDALAVRSGEWSPDGPEYMAVPANSKAFCELITRERRASDLQAQEK